MPSDKERCWLAGSTTIGLRLMPAQFLHVAFTVPDLEAAESYYMSLFAMRVITREAWGDGASRQLPHHLGWADARARGIELYMLALRRDRVVLALFDEASPHVRANGVPMRPGIVGLSLSAREIADVEQRLGPEEQWQSEQRGSRRRCTIGDRYGITWQLDTSSGFQGTGDGSGRWLDV